MGGVVVMGIEEKEKDKVSSLFKSIENSYNAVLDGMTVSKSDSEHIRLQEDRNALFFKTVEEVRNRIVQSIKEKTGIIQTLSLKNKGLYNKISEQSKTIKDKEEENKELLSKLNEQSKTIKEKEEENKKLLHSIQSQYSENKDQLHTINALKEENKRLSTEIESQSKTFLDIKKEITILYTKLEEQDRVKKDLFAAYTLLTELETKNKDLEAQLIKEQGSYKEDCESYDSYITELENELKDLRQKILDYEEKQRRNRTGKRTELSSVEIEKIIDGYCLGFSYNQIASYSGCSRMQVSRVIKGEFKHTQSKEKIVRVLNKLLKVNQNPQRLEKLKGLKDKYV